jgi:8-oxo-dGTP pyrophosphatase MutT (NUDIX family)
MKSWLLPAVIGHLRTRLEEALPGLDAQKLMAPVPRAGWRPAEIPADARHAAALLLLYPIDGIAHLALTLRTSHLPHHGGQVCLPGGAAEGDESMETTAMREAAEEIGVDLSRVTTLGRLTPLHIPVSGFVLHPVVGSTDARPSFTPAAAEVARVLDVPLPELCDPHHVRLRLRTHEGRQYEVPYFLLDGEIVWGATAMVLAELLALFGCPPFRPETPTDDEDAYARA